METLVQDIRFGLRQLLKHPGFTALAIISLALGIGANTAIFSLVNTVLLRPLPVEEPAELVELFGTLHKGATITLQSYPNYKDYRDRNQVLAGVAAYRISVMSLSDRGNNERVWGYLVSGNYFDLLGVKLALGRGFLAEEDGAPDAHPVAVLSYGCWQRRFAADPSVIGRTVSLNGRVFTVVGVAPRTFTGTEVAYAPELWVPIAMAKTIEPGSTWLDGRSSDNLFVIGRLKRGITVAQAQSALAADTLQLGREYPKENEGRGIRLLAPGLFIPDIRNAVITFAGVLTAVVALVLLLACVNLANLQLVRATARRKEIAIRLAVGASRARLIRQLLTEGVLLSVAGGAVGLLLAVWINRIVSSLKLPMDIALVFDLRTDWRVLAFSLVASVFTGVLFSLLPALQSSKPALVPTLKDDASIGGFRRSRLRNSLVVVQVALSLILLVCAGLIVRSLQAAQKMRPGFNPENAVALSLDVGLQGYDEAKGRAFQQQVLERAKTLPGVQSVALTDVVPLSLNYNSTTVYAEGQPPASVSNLPLAVPTWVTPGYFETMGIPLRGRDFTPQEKEKDSRVAIVNETFARRMFPGQEAIGRRFNSTGPEQPLFEIIGVVPDGKYNTLGEEQKMAVFRSLLRDYNSTVTIVARTSGDPRAVLGELRRTVQNLDPTLPIYDAKTLTEHMKIPLFPARMAASVLGSFGLLALILAAIGIYGVMSYVVAGRTREIGVRMALGAQLYQISRLILRQGMSLALIGLTLGVATALGAARLLTSLLYGVSPSDLLTFGGVSLLLAAVALLACYLPARRAARVNPMVALRNE